MDFSIATLGVLAVSIIGGLIFYLKITQLRNVKFSKAGLRESGFEYIFDDDSYQFIAFQQLGKYSPWKFISKGILRELS